MSFHLYSSENEYRGNLVCPEDAAAMVAFLGDGATVRSGSYPEARVLWTEGSEKQSAAESYDECVDVMLKRASERNLTIVDRVFDAYMELVHLVDTKKVDWHVAGHRVREGYKLDDSQWEQVVERYKKDGEAL